MSGLWPHRPAKFRGHGADICDDDGMRWPCPSQRYLDAMVTAVQFLPSDCHDWSSEGHEYDECSAIDRAAVLDLITGKGRET